MKKLNVSTEIEIVEYKPAYAKTVADMWNKSREGWGGHADIRTEDHVLIQEANSTNLHTYIALAGEEAVGYCGLSVYRDDEGALYIPLLNVRSDYHGKKIGKMLVLTALAETVKLGWPRLDLRTWPGNTKAVPLYKKCGFFWENRDDSVHLMNFLPMVLNTEAFNEFFQIADWYRDSVREILVEPDGIKENDFERYEYKWKKNDRFLNVAIEKTSRGICAVKNEKLSISMELDCHKVVFGKTYPVRIHVENYTNEPIDIRLQWSNNRNITFRMDEKIIVETKNTVEGTFTVKTVDEEQSSKKTHPSIVVSLTINGKTMELKTGVLPMAPVKCTGRLTGNFSSLNKEQTAYLELENNCSSPVVVRFTVPTSDEVEFKKENWTVSLKKKERFTISLPHVIRKSIFFNKTIEMLVEGEEGEIIQYDQQVTFPFNTIGSKLFGEDQSYYHLFSGMVHVALNKENNELLYERGRQNKSHYSFFYPKLGKPYSEEFSIKKPENVSFLTSNDSIGMKLTYLSQDFPNVILHRIIELTGEGLMTQHYLLENKSERVVEDIRLNHSFTFPLADTYIPYDNQVVHSKGTLNHEVSVWDEKRVSENWFFSMNNNIQAAIIWEGDAPVHFHHWHDHYFELHWGKIEPKSIVSSSKLWFGQQIFASVDEVREFANQKKDRQLTLPVEAYSFQTKNGSPIVDGEAVVSFRRMVQKNVEVNLEVSVPSIEGDERIHSISRTDSDNWSYWDVPVTLEKDRLITPIYLHGTLSSQRLNKRLLLFQGNHSHVERKIEVVNGHRSYELNNGAFSLKAAPSFFPGFYSLVDGETEWLDTSFPTPQPKAWWNPWVGGLSFGISYLLQRKMIVLPSEAQFVSVKDQFGESWTGIKITTTINDHPKYEGVVFHQYAVTRPGLPVLAVFTCIEQKIGFHFYGTVQNMYFNASLGENQGDTTLCFEPGDAGVERLQHHHHETELYNLKSIIVERKGIENKLHFIPNTMIEDLTAYMRQEIIWAFSEQPLYTKTGESEVVDPHFFVFSKEAYTIGDFKELRSLRFTLS
ncbi:GNAT family N-acetyltransferase [Evansella sp. AB-P1]|uniref:GNAT family N-acetyltransferase n=1 Tax=Evansella sp. AB-P1 TaxID=3037653 RepID=UPI00241DA010|nr:GNAT family N-acetyltransferase [Evansella sp. AB-P1]MDG5789931.1 GNAT family N-acetyltransferase [Evansella sp. AB-P1]